jgi:hypothetical protein
VTAELKGELSGENERDLSRERELDHVFFLGTWRQTLTLFFLGTQDERLRQGTWIVSDPVLSWDIFNFGI